MHSECRWKCTEMRQCHAHVSLSGTGGSRRDAKMWKMTLGVEDLQTADNVERVKQMVRGDRRLIVLMIADELEINRDSVCKIITEDLGMRKICAKMAPKLLDDDQKERHMKVCQDILEYLQTEPDLLQRVITGDESWIFEYDPETKRQSLQWKCPSSPRPKKARQSRSKIKLMLRGIVHMEFLPQG